MFDDVLKFLTSARVVESVAVALSAILFIVCIKKCFKKYMTKKYGNKFVKTPVRTVVTVSRYAIVVLAFLLILQINGINVTSLFAGLGIASAIIGLALQDLLKDAIMGMHIIGDKFFSVGDMVQYGNIKGTVISLNMRTTKIKDYDDNGIISISNRNIDKIKKLSDMLDIDIPLRYGEDYEEVDAVLLKAAKEIEKIKGVRRCEYKGTQDFEDSAITYKVRLFCSPQNMPDIRRSAMRVIQAELRENDLTIPYTTITVDN